MGLFLESTDDMIMIAYRGQRSASPRSAIQALVVPSFIVFYQLNQLFNFEKLKSPEQFNPRLCQLYKLIVAGS